MKQHSLKAAGYLFEGLNPDTMGKVLKYLIEAIEKSGIEFDTVAFRGLSGCLFGPAVAMHFKSYVAYVRKGRGDQTHSSYSLEGPERGFKYIIVDDLMASGGTVQEIIEACGQRGAECVGVFLWSQHNHWQSPVDSFKVPNCPIYATVRDLSDYRLFELPPGTVERVLAGRIEDLLNEEPYFHPQRLLPQFTPSTVSEINRLRLVDEMAPGPDFFWWTQRLGRTTVGIDYGKVSPGALSPAPLTKEVCCGLNPPVVV